MEQKTGFKEVFLRLVAIVGLIAVLILGAWGIILLAFNVVGFFSGNGNGFASLFNQNNGTTQEEPVTTTYVPGKSNNTSTGAIKVTTGTTAAPTQTSPKPTAVYTAAPQRVQLYGLPDLHVTMGSITSLNSVQGRTAVTFVVENIGTNVALSGWTFNALLPLTPAYTYQSGAQQALNPGDKIAFTLTYDNPNVSPYMYNPGQVCTMQYPNSNCNYNNQPQQQTCYTYNGYQNIPGPCYQYDQNSNPYNPNYNYYNNQNQNQYYNNGTNPNYNYYNNGRYPYGGMVTITVDPQNWVPETVEYNNSASKSF